MYLPSYDQRGIGVVLRAGVSRRMIEPSAPSSHTSEPALVRSMSVSRTETR